MIVEQGNHDQFVESLLALDSTICPGCQQGYVRPRGRLTCACGKWTYEDGWMRVQEFSQWIAPMIRTMAGTGVLEELIQVQPMSAPTAMVFYMDLVHRTGGGTPRRDEDWLPEHYKVKGAHTCRRAR